MGIIADQFKRDSEAMAARWAQQEQDRRDALADVFVTLDELKSITKTMEDLSS